MAEPSLAFALHGWSEASTSFASAAQAIRNDSAFGPLVGGMLGSQSALTRFDENTVIGQAASALLDDHGQITRDDELVAAKIAELRSYVKASDRLCTAIIPLPGLSSSDFPMELEEGLEIDQLTDEEIEACADCGVLRPPFPHLSILRPDECVGVRIKIMIPAVSAPPGESPDLLALSAVEQAQAHRFGDRSQWRLGELVEDVLFVLRLARSEVLVTLGAVLLMASPWGSSRTWMMRPTRQMVRTSYVLDQETIAVIKSLWHGPRSSRKLRRARDTSPATLNGGLVGDLGFYRPLPCVAEGLDLGGNRRTVSVLEQCVVAGV